MPLVKFAKVVSALPGTLEANTLYAVRVGTGVDLYFTNSGGTVMAFQVGDSERQRLDALEGAQYTDEDAVAAIKAADGSGSGLDADTIDGVDALSFLRNDTSTPNVIDEGVFIRYTHAEESSGADGRIGARLYDKGLNIVGLATESMDTTRYLTFIGDFRISGGLEFTASGGTTRVNRIRDQDDMSSNDAAALATQQSIKAYVDGKFTSGWTGTFTAQSGETVTVTNGIITDAS